MFSIKTHNILDYVAGVALLFVPAIFGFAGIDAARNAFLFSGFALIAYSLLTQYSYAVWRVIPVGTHMTLDVLNGVFLMLAPWVLGYRDIITAGQEIVHYVLALGVFGLVAFTRTASGTMVDVDTTDVSYRDRRAG